MAEPPAKCARLTKQRGFIQLVSGEDPGCCSKYFVTPALLEQYIRVAAQEEQPKEAPGAALFADLDALHRSLSVIDEKPELSDDDIAEFHRIAHAAIPSDPDKGLRVLQLESFGGKESAYPTGFIHCYERDTRNGLPPLMAQLCTSNGKPLAPGIGYDNVGMRLFDLYMLVTAPEKTVVPVTALFILETPSGN
jgi:hypothetical protein